MKKSNAQAELLSQPAGALRGSRPFFIFFNRLQAQAHSRGLRALRGSPAQRYFFLFFNRLQAQAQAHSNRAGLLRSSRTRRVDP